MDSSEPHELHLSGGQPPGGPRTPANSREVCEIRALATALAAALGGLLLLNFSPALELALFARGAAHLAGLFSGTSVLRATDGWLLPSPDLPVVVTTACSATDFFLMVAGLISWQLTRRGKPPVRALLAGLLTALPLAIFINSLRVVTVTQAHRWFIPLLPEAYGPFLHLLTGAAIFPPSLIALNLLLEFHGRRQLPIRA